MWKIQCLTSIFLNRCGSYFYYLFILIPLLVSICLFRSSNYYCFSFLLFFNNFLSRLDYLRCPVVFFLLRFFWDFDYFFFSSIVSSCLRNLLFLFDFPCSYSCWLRISWVYFKISSLTFLKLDMSYSIWLRSSFSNLSFVSR